MKIKTEESDVVSKANSVYSFESKIYNQVTPVKIEKTEPKSNSFFSGLDNQVKVNWIEESRMDDRNKKKLKIFGTDNQLQQYE